MSEVKEKAENSETESVSSGSVESNRTPQKSPLTNHKNKASITRMHTEGDLYKTTGKMNLVNDIDGSCKHEEKVKKIVERGHTRGGVVFRCPHTNLKHYAKGMCNTCYHMYGRKKLASNCPHKERFNYAKGVCQSCYYSQYIKRKTPEIRDKNE